MSVAVIRRAAVLLAVLAPVLAVFVPVPAQAHGAPQNPISRILVCDPAGGPGRTSAACRAAVAAGADVADWDNVRVANVDGHDREQIPDGSLCSGGIDRYQGLDLARADWPATTLTSGASYRFTYRTSIPHKGSFRMYVTKDGYDPTRPLRWSDLEARPFLTATDPPVRDQAYVMPGRLPAGKSGRHIIFTIWQNTSTPDTYYSCSDVIFRAVAAPASSPPNAAPPASSSPVPSSPAAAKTSPELAVPPAAGSHGTGTRTVATIAGGTIGLAVLGLGLLTRQRRQSRRRRTSHGRHHGVARF